MTPNANSTMKTDKRFESCMEKTLTPSKAICVRMGQLLTAQTQMATLYMQRGLFLGTT